MTIQDLPLINACLNGLATVFLKRDILLRPLGNVLYFLPPYIITDEEIHRVFDEMEDILGNL